MAYAARLAGEQSAACTVGGWLRPRQLSSEQSHVPLWLLSVTFGIAALLSGSTSVVVATDSDELIVE